MSRISIMLLPLFREIAEKTMHLRDAAVGEDGSLIVSGRLEYPPDLDRKFPPSPGETHFQIQRVGWGGQPADGVTLEVCDAVRDDRSGFLKIAPQRLRLGLPVEFGAALIRAFRHPPDAPLEMTLTGQSSAMSVPAEVDPSVPEQMRPSPEARQTLSNWTLQVAKTDDDFLHVELTAALLDLEGKKNWHREAPKNFWGNGQPEARLSVAFVVDPVTRVATYGGYAKVFGSNKRLKGHAPRASTLSTLRLEEAAVGFHGSAHGINASGDWVLVHVARNIFLHPVRSVHTDPFGFTVSEDVAGGPSLQFGISEAALVSLLSSGHCNVNFEDEGHGSVLRGWGSDRWHDPMSEMHLIFAIDTTGLTFQYRAFARDTQGTSGGEWLADTVVIPWETLLLRFPALVQLAPTRRPAPELAPAAVKPPVSRFPLRVNPPVSILRRKDIPMPWIGVAVACLATLVALALAFSLV